MCGQVRVQIVLAKLSGGIRVGHSFGCSTPVEPMRMDFFVAAYGKNQHCCDAKRKIDFITEVLFSKGEPKPPALIQAIAH